MECRFPTIRATDLDGRDHELPGGLPVGPKVLLLGFARWHQVLLAMWQAQLRSVEHQVPTLGVWQLIALPRTLMPASWLIKSGMRSASRDPEARRRVLSAYTDVDELAAALGIDDTSNVHAMLLGPDGEIVWRASGRPSAEAVGSLAEVLAWSAPGS